MGLVVREANAVDAVKSVRMRKTIARLGLGLALGLGAPVFAATSASALTTVDVLVVYPQPPATHLSKLITWGRNFGETEMGAFLDTNFAHVSAIYQQSGIDVELRVVHHQQIDLSYIDPNWKIVLSSALMNSELSTPAYVPYLAAIEDLRDTHFADIVIYWRQFGDGGPTSNGAGSIGGGEDEAYVHLTYGGINPTVVAHETGHLCGAQHSEGVQGVAEFSIGGDAPVDREYRTVMTIAVPLPETPDFRYVWRFSNDGMSVSGVIDCSQLTGMLTNCDFTGTATLGDAGHDAAATIASYAPVVAAFRTDPSTAVPVASWWGQGALGLGLILGGALRLRRRLQRT